MGTCRALVLPVLRVAGKCAVCASCTDSQHSQSAHESVQPTNPTNLTASCASLQLQMTYKHDGSHPQHYRTWGRMVGEITHVYDPPEVRATCTVGCSGRLVYNPGDPNVQAHAASTGCRHRATLECAQPQRMLSSPRQGACRDVIRMQHPADSIPLHVRTCQHSLQFAAGLCYTSALAACCACQNPQRTSTSSVTLPCAPRRLVFMRSMMARRCGCHLRNFSRSVTTCRPCRHPCSARMQHANAAGQLSKLLSSMALCMDSVSRVRFVVEPGGLLYCPRIAMSGMQLTYSRLLGHVSGADCWPCLHSHAACMWQMKPRLWRLSLSAYAYFCFRYVLC